MGHKINWTNENEKLFSLLMGAGQGWARLGKSGQVWTSLDKFGRVLTSLDKAPKCLPVCPDTYPIEKLNILDFQKNVLGKKKMKVGYKVASDLRRLKRKS